jgi:Tfp pilus assembly protein PilX
MIQKLQRRDEQGAALIVSLAFLSLFGIFIAAILAHVSTNMRLTGTTRARADRLMAADGGLEWGIQQARTQDTMCPSSTAAGQEFLDALQVDDRNVTVSCQAIAGAVASPAAQQWSVIATNGVSTGAGANPTITGGDVWSPAFTPAGATQQIALTEADAIRGAMPSCPADFTLPAVTVGDPDLLSCSTLAAPDVPHVLPAAPTAVAPNFDSWTCGGRTWRIWHPGIYNSTFQPDPTPYNYLESGVYYFDSVNPRWRDISAIVGGSPPPGETSTLGMECATVNDGTMGPASRATGKGVTIVLGGTSSIRIENASRVELYSRVPDTPDGTPGITIMTVPSGTPGPVYQPWTGPLAPLPAAALTQSGTGRTAIHGLVYARTAPISITTGLTAPLQGGVVAQTLTITLGAGGRRAVQASGRRTLLLTSVAAPAAAGEISATQSAVVKIANDPTRTASVRSWRAQ